jgi:hypothetical protein
MNENDLAALIMDWIDARMARSNANNYYPFCRSDVYAGIVFGIEVGKGLREPEKTITPPQPERYAWTDDETKEPPK